MNLNLDTEKFEELQEGLISEIIKSTATKLVEAGMQGLALEEATASIAFSIASIIDDTTRIESDGGEVHPYLTFRTDDGELVHCGENAYTYEYVRGALKALFDV